MRNIIIEKAFIGFTASREQFDLGDKIGMGETEQGALAYLLEMEEK